MEFTGNVCSRVFALLVATVLAAAPAVPAWASEVHRFDIPEEDGAAAIHDFGSQAHVQILVAGEAVKDKKLHAVSGEFSTEDALNRLLSGSGLSHRYVGDNSVALLPVSLVTEGAAQTAAPSSQAPNAPDNRSSLQLAQVDQAISGSQVTDENKERKKPSEVLEEVVVTGTHIRGVQPTSPVIVLDSTAIQRSGYTDVGDLMRSIPQNFGGGNSPTIQVGNGSSSASQDNYSPSGGSAPNLRGLGASSTLTLVDGRRLAEDNGYGAVDISSIPVIAIDRIEVVTDGASAIYGSDAVAGVVNFILKKPYDGAVTSASVGRATSGGGFDRRFDQLVGKTWNGGGAILVYEHDKQDQIDSSQRDFTDTAPTPYYLLPLAKRDSLFLNAKQDFSSTLTAFAEGLYTQRYSDVVYSYPPSYAEPSHVRQYQATAGFTAALPRDWSATLFGSASEQRTVVSLLQFTPGVPGSIPVSPDSDLIGRTRTLEIDGDGSLFDGPGGTVKAAVGAGNRVEAFHEYFADGSGVFGAGERTIQYAFSELNAPLIGPSERTATNRLELVASGRFERYSDFGNKWVPKLGILYVPSTQVRLHATWSQSFRAPTLTDLSGPRGLFLIQIADPLSPTGQSVVMQTEGGNPNLRPETATSVTVGFDYKPEWLPTAELSTTYFQIKYANRIGTLPSFQQALSYTGYAPFVTRNPSLALQQQLIQEVDGNLVNQTGLPYDPSTVAALVNSAPINVSTQNIKGVDVAFKYQFKGRATTTDFFFDGNYLNYLQQLTDLTPEQSLSGTVFNPPRFRARAGATWTGGPWSATGIANYLGSESNEFPSDRPDVSSWTTFDVLVSLEPREPGWLSGFRASLAVQNIFNTDPPTVHGVFIPGLNYDSFNTTPLGRYVTLSLSKSWF